MTTRAGAVLAASLVALPVGISACGDSIVIVNRERTDSYQQSPTDEVDILFVVDNSNSMQLEQTLLADGFESFIEGIEQANVDFHLGVISTNFEYDDGARGTLELTNTDIDGCDGVAAGPPYLTLDDDYLTLFPCRAQVGLNGSGKEKGLEAALYALGDSLTGPGGANEGFLRDDANLLVVFVSDEDDCSDEGALGANADNTACYSQRDLLTPASDLTQRIVDLKGVRGKVQLAAIVGPESAESVCDDTTLPGTRYLEAAELTDGLQASICETDWSGFLNRLGLEAVGIQETFPLSYPANPETLEVRVDDEVVEQSDSNGWTYIADPPSVQFHGDAIPARGSDIAITYEIASGV